MMAFNCMKNTLVSKRIERLKDKLNWNSLSQNSSITISNVLDFPNAPWNYSELSDNPSILFDDVARHPNKPWCWDRISKRRIMFQTVKDHIDRPWNFKNLSTNCKLTMKDILDHREKQWCWEALSIRVSTDDGITLDDVTRYPDLPWNYGWISMNPHIKMEHVLMLRNKPWGFSVLSITIPFQEILQNSELPWVWRFVSYNKTLDFQYVFDHPENQWNWTFLSENPALTIQDVVSNTKQPWDWNAMSKNPSITVQDILDHPKLPWNWEYVVLNPSISLKQILDHHPDMKQKWQYISSTTFTVKDVVENPYLPWKLDLKTSIYDDVSIHDILKSKDKRRFNNKRFYVSLTRKDPADDNNPIHKTSFLTSFDRFTFDTLIDHLDRKWNWTILSKNPSIFHLHYSDKDYIEYVVTHMAKYKIRKSLFANPRSKLCRKRLMREFDMLSNNKHLRFT
jgi:hypothetical protein